jgi:hypothetical protein
MDAPGCLRCGKAWLRRDGPKKLDARNWNGWAEAGQCMDGSSLAGWERAGLHKAEARWDGWLWAGCNWSEARSNGACSTVPGQ